MGDLAEKLRRDEDLRRQGAVHVVDVLMRRKVSEVVDLGGLRDLVLHAMGEPLVDRLVNEHLDRMWERHKQRSREANEQIGDNLPEAVRSELGDIVATMELPRFAWAGESVDMSLLRDLFAPALSAWLVSFVKKLPVVGGGLGGGLAGALKSVGGRSTKAVLGNIDEKMQSRAEGFSRSAMNELRQAIAQRLQSEEGRGIVETLRRQLFEAIMSAELATVMDDLDRMPRKQVLGLFAPTIAHNAARSFGRALVHAEIDALLSLEGERTLEELATEAGVLPQVRAYVRVQAETLLEQLLQDDAFVGWLKKL